MIDRARVKELYLQGKKGTHIAAVLGCKPPTVWRIHRELQKAGELDARGDGQTMPDEQPEQQLLDTRAAARILQGKPPPLAADPDILRQQKENELLRLQAERERLQREIQSRPAEIQAAAGGAGEIGILRVELMGELRELRRTISEQLMNAIRDLQRDQAAVLEKVGQTKEIDLSALQAMVGNNGGDSLETTIPLVKKIIELGKELGGGGSGDDDQTSIEKLGTTILSGIFSGRRVPAQPGMAPTAAHQVDPMQARIWSFLSSIEREAKALTDPWTIAEILEKELNVCPEPFRNLVLNNTPNAILSGLGRFVPQGAHARITGLMQQNPQARQWLDAFIEALQGEEALRYQETEVVTPAEFEEQPANDSPPQQPPPEAAQRVGTGYTEDDLFGDPEKAFPTTTPQPHPGSGAVAPGA